MDELENLRDRLLESSEFVLNLQAAPSSTVNTILGYATVKQLRALVDGLHNVVNGNITISKLAYKGIEPKIDALIEDFGEQAGYNFLVDEEAGDEELRRRQLSTLAKYKNYFGYLLSPFT